MLKTIFATKGSMSQAWTKDGKRLPITKCLVDHNLVLGTQKVTVKTWHNSNFSQKPCLIFEIGYGKKKLKNMPKPLRTQIEKSGFSFGFKQIKGVRMMLDQELAEQELPFKPGESVEIEQVLKVGDIVKVQGTSKGKGFAGVVKRHGMAGGPRTRGQSDRQRAVGSIGASADWGRVFPGKRMPGHLGTDTTTVRNLTVVYIDPEKREVWLSGPIPGHLNSIVQITNTGTTKQVELNHQASGIKEIASAQSESTETETVDSEKKVDSQSSKKDSTQEKKSTSAKPATTDSDQKQAKPETKTNSDK